MSEQNGWTNLLPKEKLLEWIFRLIVLLGLFYLSNTYVSIKDYRKDEERKVVEQQKTTGLLDEIKITLARIEERTKVENTKERIEDHEQRLRVLEARTTRP